MDCDAVTTNFEWPGNAVSRFNPVPKPFYMNWQPTISPSPSVVSSTTQSHFFAFLRSFLCSAV